jgi:hypothetical protein
MGTGVAVVVLNPDHATGGGGLYRSALEAGADPSTVSGWIET